MNADVMPQFIPMFGKMFFYEYIDRVLLKPHLNFK